MRHESRGRRFSLSLNDTQYETLERLALDNGISHAGVLRRVLSLLSAPQGASEEGGGLLIQRKVGRIAELVGVGGKAEPVATTITRSLEFPPEYQQAGMQILSYFSTYVKNRFPATASLKVQIEQDFPVVRLIITAPNEQTRYTVERSLDEYGLIVSGRVPPDELLNNELHIVEINNKLRLAHVELENSRALLALSARLSDQRIEAT
jgi:hypothetical protein